MFTIENMFIRSCSCAKYLFKLYVCCIVVLVCCVYVESSKTVEKCESCNKLVKNFIENLDKTAKGNFGGGNTDWEDRKLGNYLTSETRFEEIIESICSDNECNRVLEEYEDYLFDWFKNKQNVIKNELNTQFCINVVKYCCPANMYGEKCTPCPANLNQTCSGNGKCDGDGTRKGNGKCSCNDGYVGDLCDSCKNGYFEEIKNDSLIKCTECYKACKTTCMAAGPNGCLDCKDGWLFEDGKCNDVDECAANTANCGENEYCENVEGSFNCRKCDRSCEKCTGFGADKCVSCSSGYKMDENNNCVDIDECKENPNICGTDDTNDCQNTPGSFTCKEKEEPTKDDNNDDDSDDEADDDDEETNNDEQSSDQVEHTEL